MGFLSFEAGAFSAGVEAVDCFAGCEATGCEVEAGFDGVALEPLCLSVGRSGSSAGAEVSAVLWLVSEEDGVGVGEASGVALLSGR